MRVGVGYDVHRFDDSRPLVLGGVTIQGTAGLAGWSDADVISHAIVDALLGAAGLGDMGAYFTPKSIPEGFSSLKMLERTAQMIEEAGYQVVNVDSVVVIQDVTVAPHSRQMVKLISEALGIDTSQVNIKATTTDRLGLAGRGEGAAATAVALLETADGAGSRPRP
jgi:2-C-methyl-D-erythritol 2,4-cyclodiphosphate synthase